jgi:hypothetical protein
MQPQHVNRLTVATEGTLCLRGVDELGTPVWATLYDAGFAGLAAAAGQPP